VLVFPVKPPVQPWCTILDGKVLDMGESQFDLYAFDAML
jgi:hypothetical protein